jgi:2-hydroxycyclohexanecarboxyl-CoA dehydrogenase
MNGSRTAVITGGAGERSIGRATARAFAERGWAVAVLDIDGDLADRVASDIASDFGVASIGGFIDVADEQAVTLAKTRIEDAVRRTDLPAIGALANIAGITSPTRLLDTDLDTWNRIMGVNATGTYLVTKAFLPGMLELGFGRIINMSSVSAQRGGGVFGGVAYAAAKSAILGLTKALARELGDSGVTVNAVAPGAVDTNIRSRFTDEMEAGIVAGIPLGRTASPEEIAAIFVFLASDAAAYVQGATIDVNGGSHLH